MDFSCLLYIRKFDSDLYHPVLYPFGEDTGDTRTRYLEADTHIRRFYLENSITFYGVKHDYLYVRKDEYQKY